MYSPALIAGQHSMKAVILSIGLTLSCISVADPTVTSIVIFLPCQHCTRSSHDSSRLRARRRSTHDHRSAPATRVIHDFHLSSDRRAQILSGCRFCFTLDERLSEGAFAVLLPRSRCISFSRGRSIRALHRERISDTRSFCSCRSMRFRHCLLSLIPFCRSVRHFIHDASGDAATGRSIFFMSSSPFHPCIFRIEYVTCKGDCTDGAVSNSRSRSLICLFSFWLLAEQCGGRG